MQPNMGWATICYPFLHSQCQVTVVLRNRLYDRVLLAHTNVKTTTQQAKTRDLPEGMRARLTETAISRERREMWWGTSMATCYCYHVRERYTRVPGSRTKNDESVWRGLVTPPCSSASRPTATHPPTTKIL